MEIMIQGPTEQTSPTIAPQLWFLTHVEQNLKQKTKPSSLLVP